MRTSKRTAILEAAARIVHDGGVADLTYESIAAESGITKGGILYHFPTRQTMISAIHHYLASRWESDMEAVAGAAPNEISALDRLHAYVDATTHSVTRTELLFMLEGATQAELTQPWMDVVKRWAPAAPDTMGSSDELDRFVSRLAADGLWVYESMTDQALTSQWRQAIAERIAQISDPRI